MADRIGQIAALHRATNARVIQQRPPGFEADFDVAQALAIRQLRKDHRREVIVGRQRRGVATHRILRCATRRLFAAEAGEHLGEDRLAGVHARNRAKPRQKKSNR